MKILIEKVDNGYVIKDLLSSGKRAEVIQENESDKYSELKAYRSLAFTLMQFLGVQNSRKDAHLEIDIHDKGKIIQD